MLLGLCLGAFTGSLMSTVNQLLLLLFIAFIVHPFTPIPSVDCQVYKFVALIHSLQATGAHF